MANEPVEWFGAGGGVNNAYLWQRLNQHIAPMQRTDAFGVISDAREAIAFALLAAATLDGEPSNVPSATGASRRVILGSITPKPFRP
jgi:anhydro-N-acetylmuramic acid kinase